jgi:hypothetical protein
MTEHGLPRKDGVDQGMVGAVRTVKVTARAA